MRGFADRLSISVAWSVLPPVISHGAPASTHTFTLLHARTFGIRMYVNATILSCLLSDDIADEGSHEHPMKKNVDNNPKKQACHIIYSFHSICHPTIAGESTKFFTQFDDAIDTYVKILRRLLDLSTPPTDNTHQAIYVNQSSVPFIVSCGTYIQGYSEKVDIFSMGIVFWQLLALRSVPFEGHHRHEIHGLVVEDQRPFVDPSWDPSYAQVRRVISRCVRCARGRASALRCCQRP